MKKTCSIPTLILFCVMLANKINAQVTVTYDTIPSQLKTCSTNHFTAHFTLPTGGPYVISIKDSINFACGGSSSCTGTHLTAFNLIDTTGTGDFSYNPGTHSWQITLNSGYHVLDYNVQLDCGVIPSCLDSATSSVKLFQVWNSSVTFNISGFNYLSAVIFYPHFEETTANFFIGNYLDTVPVYHIYLNTGNADADIQFSFNPSPSNTCSAVTLDSVKYDVGTDTAGLSFSNIASTGWNTVQVPIGQALIVRKTVVVHGCVDATCSQERDNLIWRCNFANSAFCDTCQHIYNKQYAFQRGNTDTLKLTRTFPVSNTYDYSCTGTKVQWQYVIKNTGNVNFHHSLIELYSFTAFPPNQLSLIDTADIDTLFYLSPNSIVQDSIKYMPGTTLCADSISHPLARLNLYITNFLKGDSIILKFKTYRCCEENDTALSNKSLGFGDWVVKVTSNDSCGGADAVTGGYINNNPHWDMTLNYFPTCSDLTVPQDSVFGPSTPILTVEERSLAAEYAPNYQLLGCTGTAANCLNNMHGLLRVHIHCQPGLVIDTPQVRFVNFPLKPVHTWNPVFYYSTILPNVCDTADYYYYFQLSDTNSFALLDSGMFQFRLRSCCGANEPRTPYSVDFHLLLDPEGTCHSVNISDTTHTQPPLCNDCCFLPLARTGDKIAIRCPGCKAPGIEINSYTLKRISLGLKDSTNNQKADIPLSLVDSAYLSAYGSLMRTSFANHGDHIEDLMTGHFQDGDPNDTPPGYNYNQMLSDSGILKFIQLDRQFKLEDSSQMSITPYNFKLYVDILASGGNDSCIDCYEYNVGINYRTVHIISVNAAQMNTYVQYDPANYRVFFTFDASANNSSHNMFANVSYHDPNPLYEFTRWMPPQRYRMKTDYAVCGHIDPDNINNAPAEQIHEADVINRMYLCGQQLPVHANDSVGSMPNDSSELALHGDTIPPIFNQSFANKYRFICVAHGGRFYFYSDETQNNSKYISDASNGCLKQIQINAYAQTGGNLSITSPALYPYEYKLPSLKPYHCKAKIPPGYSIDTVATVHSAFLVNGTNNGYPYNTANRNFIVHSVADSVEINIDSLFIQYPIQCLPDTASNTASLNLYSGDNKLNIFITIDLIADNCNPGAKNAPEFTDIKTQFKDNLTSCFGTDSLYCDLLITDPQRPYHTDTVRTPDPQLSVYFSPSAITAGTHRMCWKMSVTNFTDPAYNVFIIPQPVSYLSNWTLNSNGTIIAPDSSGVFHFSNVLNAPFQLYSDSICVQYNSCVDSAIIPVYYGWNCSGYPAGFDSSLCSYDTTYISFTDGTFSPELEQVNPDTINLCEPFIIRAELTNSGTGSLYPFQLYADSLASGMTVTSVQLTSCFNQDTITLGGNSPYSITDSVLAAIGITDSIAFGSSGDCLIALLTVEQQCSFIYMAGDTVLLPYIHVLVTSFCNDTSDVQDRVISTSPLQSQAIYGVSYCTDCFTLTKTASSNPASALSDTVTFTITVCGNNATATPDSIFEFLPSDFTVLTSNAPFTDSIPANGCNTYLITGYFNTAGSCSGSHKNIVQVITANGDTLRDSVCVTVVAPCAAQADIIIPDSSFSSFYGTSIPTGTQLIDTSILVQGRLYLDKTLYLLNCRVYMATGAQIIVLHPGDSLLIDNTIITGCTNMWRGIQLDTVNTVFVSRQNSAVRDAEYAVYAKDRSRFYISTTDMSDCVHGIFLPVNPAGANMATGMVTGTKFGLYKPAFLPDYFGQPSHGVLPRAGILTNDGILTIGDNAYPPNTFYNMNTGVLGFRSNLKIYNSLFEQMNIDTFYHKTYSGTAMVSIGDKDSAKAGRLTVMPQVSDTAMVQNSFRGIYTGYSALSATGLNFVNLNTGVYSSKCTDLLTSVVSYCKMEVSRYGIFWLNNKGAQYMRASQDTIVLKSPVSTAIIKGGTGAILLLETNKNMAVNYSVFDNTISLDSAFVGILANSVHKPNITFNKITVNGQAPQIAATGIAINGCDSASVTCNRVRGKFPVDSAFHSIGIAASVSTRNSITCNAVDSTYYGVFFGGVSPSRFKGNEMNTHFEGLHLNSAAVIDTQAHAGNEWWGPFNSGFGGVNLNSSPFGIAASQFVIDPNLTSEYFFSNPNPGWILLNIGNTFYCSNSTVCTIIQNEDISEELARRIAEDSLQTSEFEFESQIMAEMYLYEQLKNDTDLLASDSLYRQFMHEDEFTSTAYLYEAGSELRATTEYDETFTSLLNQADSLIVVYTDSIAYLEALGCDCPERFDGFYYEIDLLNQIVQNLILQRKIYVDGAYEAAMEMNELVLPVGLPDENEAIMNEMEARLYAEEVDGLTDYYYDILAIAQQCPYAGGPAVYRARTLIALLNDTVEYDDATVCLLAGIYRKSNPIKEKENNSIQIIPNPANDYLKIILNNSSANLCKISVFNSLGEELIIKTLDCKQKEYVMNISGLSQGAYYIKVSLDDEPVQGKKLIIIR